VINGLINGYYYYYIHLTAFLITDN